MSQPNFETFIVDTPELFDSLKKYVENIRILGIDSDIVAYDIETNSKNEKTALIYGFGLAFTEQKAFYIPWRRPDGSLVWGEQGMARIKEWLWDTLAQKKVIGHNIIYDALVTENNFGYDISQFIHADTLLMKHTLDEENPFGLKDIAVTTLGAWADKAQDKLKAEVEAAGGRWTNDQKDMYLASTATLGEYCCWDVILTIMLFYEFEPKLIAEGVHDLFYNEEIMPLYKEVTIDMKRKGFPIDVPYYENLRGEITAEINNLEAEIHSLIKNDVQNFEFKLIDEDMPIARTGNFPKYYAEVAGIVLPIQKKTGKITIAKKAIELQKAAAGGIGDELYDYILGTGKAEALKADLVIEAQKKYFFSKNSDSKYIFNLRSNDHLIELVFNKWGFQPEEHTPGGKPKIDDDYFETLKGNPVVDKLKDYKKLNKLLSTYVEGILDRQMDGIIYTSMLQFGTTSGRYSSRDPNLQNQPRIKDEDSGLSALVLKYVNAIRKGFIAGPNRKVVNADYSSLEPVCFAHASGDEKLRDVFRKGEDLYSRVAIETLGLSQYSALKKDPMYLKLHKPEFRQNAKIFCLAVPYGAEASRISDEMGISYKDADDIIQKYLNGFPGLKKYMYRCNHLAKTNGYAKTEFGRIRHLKEAKAIHTLYTDKIMEYKYAKKMSLEDVRRKYKNCLNNAKNFPIQGLAAHIVNRAMIAIAREFKKQGIQGWIALQVHDEITCIVIEEHADRAAKIVKDKMENTTKISVPLQAEPLIANNWGEAK